jgi:hypothetical protein
VSQTVRCKGPDYPRIGEFPKKFLLSRIIYGIPDSRLRKNGRLRIDGYELYAPDK